MTTSLRLRIQLRRYRSYSLLGKDRKILVGLESNEKPSLIAPLLLEHLESERGHEESEAELVRWYHIGIRGEGMKP